MADHAHHVEFLGMDEGYFFAFGVLLVLPISMLVIDLKWNSDQIRARSTEPKISITVRISI